MIRIYTLALRLGLIVLSPYFLLRSRKYWPTIHDRLGNLKVPQFQNSIWVHAVSVGEVRAVEVLIERIRLEFPGQAIVMSTTTPAGQGLAQSRRDIIDATFYFPFDLPVPVGRALDRVRPALVIVAETEIWPNFLRECRRRQVPVMLINGRISDKSLPRYRRVRRWLAPVFDDYAILGMQSEVDRQRIQSVGAQPERTQVFGNLKFDGRSSDKALDPKFTDLLRTWNPLWIAASTMPGEDPMVLDAFLALRQSRPSLKLMIAPRHPERAGDVVGLAQSRGLKVMRRTALESDTEVLVLDTIGELAASFEFASIVFMGGSLVPRGGHNILEPARYSKAVIFGPHMENFRDIARTFLEARAALQIPNSAALAPMIDSVLANPSVAESLGKNAHRILSQNTGATDRVMDFIRRRIPKAEQAWS